MTFSLMISQMNLFSVNSAVDLFTDAFADDLFSSPAVGL